MIKKFTMIDEDFTCVVCGQEVKALGYTARDHCPHCLSSKHVDNNPGDRQATCHGILEAVAIDPNKKGTYKIVYKCKKCQATKRNINATDDNLDKIIEIMKRVDK